MTTRSLAQGHRQEACAAPVSECLSCRRRQVDGFRRTSASQAKADRVNVLVSIQGRAMAKIEPPQPRVIHGGVAKLGEAHASGPGTFTLMHLQQALTNARVNVRSDDALNLGAFARVRVFIVTRTVVRRDAPGVTRGKGRLVAHGWLRARKHVLP